MGAEKNRHAVAFGMVLKELRKEAGLSQEAFAERAELNRTFISFLERGEQQPTLTTLISLAAALKIGPDELVRISVLRIRK